MDTLEKAELTAWICQIRAFLKLEIHIYNPEVPDHYGIGEKRVWKVLNIALNRNEFDMSGLSDEKISNDKQPQQK